MKLYVVTNKGRVWVHKNIPDAIYKFLRDRTPFKACEKSLGNAISFEVGTENIPGCLSCLSTYGFTGINLLVNPNLQEQATNLIKQINESSD